jgi:hypothetical protein
MEIGNTVKSETVTCTSSCYGSICCWHPECFNLDFLWRLQTLFSFTVSPQIHTSFWWAWAKQTHVSFENYLLLAPDNGVVWYRFTEFSARDVASIFSILCKLNNPEDMSSTFHRSADIFLPDHTASHPKTQYSQSLLWGSQTSQILLALRPEVGLDESKKIERNPYPLPGIELPFLCLCICCAISQKTEAFWARIL